ncbi:MAG: IMPACT family protein [Halanaerobiaceae bacterium]
MKEEFCTPSSSIEILHKIKDSKFYGNIKSVNSKEEVEFFLNTIRQKHSDANHNVFAYRIFYNQSIIRYSDDDGEPGSSSGPPVLQAIEGSKLTNTIIIVSRYFGGTKLGIGGLIRAYGETARLLIENAGKKKLVLHKTIKINIDYNLIGNVLGQIEAFALDIKKTEYTNEGANIIVSIKSRLYEKFKKTLVEKTANKVSLQEIGYKYI